MAQREQVRASGGVSPSVKAHTTGRWAETLFKALSSRVARRWRFVSFRGANRGEWCGVVDLVAIRKDTAQPAGELLKRGDLFDIVLVQLKGGTARAPTAQDKQRLQAVAKRYRARAVVQFCWRKGECAEFSVLQRNLQWKPSTGAEIFG